MPVLGFAVPIAIWQIKKDVMPEIDQHGRNVANWLIAYMFYWVISVVLVLLLVGIALLWVLAVVGVIFPIIGGIKASQGEVWKYPGAFPFF